MRSKLIASLFFSGISCVSLSQAQQFQLLKSSDTNVKFNNEIKDVREHNILIYSNYYGGAGVGVGDFNKDGLQDIFFAGNLVDDKLYINQGDFEFKDITKSAGINKQDGWSSGVIVADVNQDGWEDIYVTRELYDDQPELRKNLLYINNGDLTFTESAEQYGIADDARTRHATFLDYDNDGDLDLYCLNQPPNPGNYSDLKDTDLTSLEYTSRLYRNDGNKFEDVTEAARMLRTGFPNSVSASDLNNDGLIDLYVAHDYDAPDALYINQGDGTFKDAILDATGHISFYSMGVDAGDIDNDGLLDVMVLDMVAEDNFRLKANMSGMNPDSFWDVVRDGGHHQYMFNSLQLNRGNNTFSDIAQYANVPSTDWSWSNLIVDLDNDGFKDIYITNGLLRDIRNTDAEKAFIKYVNKSITEYIMRDPNNANVTIWDVLDLEKALDIMPSQKLPNYAYRNSGDLSFNKTTADWGMDQPSFSNGSAYADLNNDGWMDLIVSNVNDEAFIYQNKGGDAHYLQVELKDENATVFGSKVEIETEQGPQHYELTSVRGMYSTSQQIAHFGIGNSEMVKNIKVTWPDGTITTQKNVKADQAVKISKTKSRQNKSVASAQLFEKLNSPVDYAHKENVFDDYYYQVLIPHKQSQYGPAAATADVNGDGKDDLFMGGASGQSAQLFISGDDGLELATNQPWQAATITEDLDASFFDFDGDNDLDLYVVCGGNEFEPGSPFYTDRMYLNDGQGNFTESSADLSMTNVSGSKVRPFDYDQDGDVDLLVTGRLTPRDWPAPASSLLLENQNGQLIDVTTEKASMLSNLGLVTDATWTDVNGDNQPDIIMTGEWMPLTVLIQQDGRFVDQTEKLGLAKTNGWWYSVTPADFDSDGDIDFVFGNLGLNYKYKASEKEPFEVFYDDFDQNGSKDIVLSYYNFGERFPVRGRSCSIQQVPELGQKFESYTLFAGSGLGDIYGTQSLQQSLHYQAYNFASVYAENDGQGNLTLKPLPARAQISSINDCLAVDINKDGNLDLITGGNLYPAEIETTRNDAGIGLALMGDGKGNFKVVNAAQSGIYSSKDIKRIVQLNDQVIFISNDDTPDFYQAVND